MQPKRDEMGGLALDTKLMESLQSYRVSFSLLPLIAKKEATPSPTKTAKPFVSQGGKGVSETMDQIQRREKRWKGQSESAEPHLQAWWNGIESSGGADLFWF